MNIFRNKKGKEKGDNKEQDELEFENPIDA